MEHAPRRTCVGCRTTRAKPELTRIAATPEGARVDPDHHLPGRGAYICPDLRCIELIERAEGHPLRRALRTSQPNDEGIAAVLAELHHQLEPRARHHSDVPAPDTGSTPAA